MTQHQNTSKVNLEYLDPTTNEKYLPYCVEPAVGVERLMLAFMCDAYDEEEIGENDTRIVMHFHPALAPIKACVLPLNKKLQDQAQKIYADLAQEFCVEYDEAGSIGKRYRRQDAIGTPFCITIDFDTENDGCVTVRNRDTMEQERVAISDLKETIKKSLVF